MADLTLLSVVGGVSLTGLIAFGVYRAMQRERVRSINAWIKDYLFLNHKSDFVRNLRINCSDDSLWPVIVRFVDTQTNVRHRLLFSCAGDSRTFRLQSASEESD